MAQLTKGRGYVYAIRYHIIWCVRFRRKILAAAVEGRLRELLTKIAEDNDFSIVEFHIAPDYVRILADCSPQHHIPDMIKALKGVSARLLMKEYGDSLKELLWDRHLWNPSYFIATESADVEEHIRVYLQSQKKKD